MSAPNGSPPNTALIRSHPSRASLSEEMHVRRLPRFAAPCRMVQVVTLLGEASADQAREHIGLLAEQGRIVVPFTGKYAVLDLDGMFLVWERHTEFATYTLLRPGPFASPFDVSHMDPVQSAVLSDLPGEVVRATQIAFVAADAAPPAPEALEQWFVAEGMVICGIAADQATIYSDFRLNGDGFGRLLVHDHGMLGDEPPQMILRLQELGNYRNMALLGLPLAQRLTPSVTRLEARLAELTHAVSERTSEDDLLMDELSYLSAELARLLEETRYRMSATRAYGQISMDRLASLKSTPIRGFQTLADFTERRLVPALRTCESFSARLGDLSQRAAWTSELLRTRIDIALAKQNRDLLTSMDRRTQLQLRLQQTVEGISVVAISYYLVSLVGYVLKALHLERQDIAMALAVPVVLAFVALGILRLRRHLSE